MFVAVGRKDVCKAAGKMAGAGTTADITRMPGYVALADDVLEGPAVAGSVMVFVSATVQGGAVVLRCSMLGAGGQCVMTTGTTMMPTLCAVKWVIPAVWVFRGLGYVPEERVVYGWTMYAAVDGKPGYSSVDLTVGAGIIAVTMRMRVSYAGVVGGPLMLSGLAHDAPAESSVVRLCADASPCLRRHSVCRCGCLVVGVA